MAFHSSASVLRSLHANYAGNPKLVAVVRQLVEDDVYHCDSVVMKKEPHAVARSDWHQDFPHWFRLGCPRPQTVSVFVAIDPTDERTGCVQVLPGSHVFGRLRTRPNPNAQSDRFAHVLVDPEDPVLEPVLASLVHHPVTNVRMQPGDVLFLHSNVLHAAAENASADRVWFFVCTYNAVTNRPQGAAATA
eukprot:TRINITY_DN84039_c0_g1_i2.p1 TRINITY_DN84039_c0_g1~~TRINITY_DN84039_c0_g1_i2.p1  ORF type:complete len:190 (-),score=31.70 TRINITY_DN84039_c0_g1_i2:91-660(-)